MEFYTKVQFIDIKNIKNIYRFCAEHTRKAMVARQKSLRKRPPSDPTHRILDELSHYKQAKTEVKTESNSTSGGDFEDLEKDITPFGMIFYSINLHF